MYKYDQTVAGFPNSSRVPSHPNVCPPDDHDFPIFNSSNSLRLVHQEIYDTEWLSANGK